MSFDISFFCAKYNLPENVEIVLDGQFPQTFQNFQKNFKKQSGIYGWVHKKTFQTYVGSAMDLSSRPFRHLFASVPSNKHLKSAFKKHGLNLFVLVIFKVLGKTENVSSQLLQEKEDFYLNLVS